MQGGITGEASRICGRGGLIIEEEAVGGDVKDAGCARLFEGSFGGIFSQQQRCLGEQGFDGQGFTIGAGQRLEEDLSLIILRRSFVAGLMAGL